jgi:hypothetical protein
MRWSATKCRTRPCVASPPASISKARTSFCSPTSIATCRSPRHIWEQRGPHRASTLLEYLFPGLASAETLAAVDSWLAKTTANPSARRLVSEGRDDIARAIAAQQRDAIT